MSDSLITIHTDLNGNPEIHLNFELRDLFAAFALAGIMAANLDQDYSVDASMAYNYADAMLKRRGDIGL